MKNLIVKFTLAIFILPINSLFAQNEIKSAPEIHWLGIDFTKVKMIGDEGFSDPETIAKQYIAFGWNDLLFDEYDKYNIKEFLRGKEVEKYPEYMAEYNEAVTADGLVITDDYQLDEQDIKEAVEKYQNLEDGEIYMSLIVESFNKPEEEGSIWFTFFNGNNEVLYTKEMIAEPGGFGFRNYWARSIYNALKDFEKVYKKMK